MFSKKDLIFPFIVLFLLTALSFVFLFSNGGEFIKTHRLKKDGVNTVAAVAGKKVISSPKFTDIFADYERKIYLVTAIYSFNDKSQTCNLSVSRATYDAFSIRDEFGIIYLPSSPEDCTLPASLTLNYYLLASVMAAGFVFFLISAGFGFYIYSSFKKPLPDKPVKTTTRIELEEVFCPACKSKMTEGYMPTVGGVSWRDKCDPVGIPTILNGLPGTTFWVKRPRLHAFHCKNCNLITFKYGKS